MNYCILLFFTLLSTFTVSLKPYINVTVEELSAGSNKTYIINNNTEYIIAITNLSYNVNTFPPRVCVECSSCDKLNPAIVTFKQERGVASFQLPVVMKNIHQQEVLFNHMERTLCPYESYSSKNIYISRKSPTSSASNNDNLENILIVSLSTSSKKNVSITLKVFIVEDFILESGVNKTVTLTPTSPVFYLHEFSNISNELSVLIKAESESGHCMIMSIHNKSCPLYDTNTVFHNGYFQTVSYLGAITVTNDKFPYGFYVAFSLFVDDGRCSSDIIQEGERSKTLVLSISKTISTQNYAYVILGTVLVILIFWVVMIILIHFYFMRKDIIVPVLETYYPTESCEPSTSANNEAAVPYSKKILSPATDDTLSIKTDSSLDETDIDALTDAELDKNIFRTKLTLCLSDLAKKNPTVLKKKSELYMWSLTTVAIFYVLPALQLVLNYQSDLHQSGNQDICYYNFLCSHPLGYMFDFNHFFSNIGYVALGILFLIITYRKKSVHNTLLAQNKTLDRHYGVPQHFGLFYAMGISLIIEGVLSSIYHICPNIYNFKFDVSFMYVISTLCMIKIYQSRHPDVNATAYSTFLLIGLIIFLDILGLFVRSSGFWIVTAVAHLGTIFYISLHIYYVGRFSFDLRAVLRYIKQFRICLCLNGHFWRPVYPTRFILLLLINICNWGLAMQLLFLNFKDFSSHLLLIFLANLILYTTFYIIMKIVSKEKILLQSCIYMVLAVLSWSAAFYYYYHKTITWKKTPAESRVHNKPCELFNFYDNHDIWHFLSSAGMFFSFLVLLTLDDDLIFIDRCQIPVF